MFNVGGPEILVILVVALMILGPEQLPKAMRTFGNASAEIKKVSGGFQAEMRKAMETIETTATSATSPVATPAKASVGGTASAEPSVPDADR